MLKLCNYCKKAIVSDGVVSMDDQSPYHVNCLEEHKRKLELDKNKTELRDSGKLYCNYCLKKIEAGSKIVYRNEYGEKHKSFHANCFEKYYEEYKDYPYEDYRNLLNINYDPYDADGFRFFGDKLHGFVMIVDGISHRISPEHVLGITEELERYEVDNDMLGDLERITYGLEV